MAPTPLSPQEASRIIESSAHIHMHAFQVAIGVLTGFALSCFVPRLAIRIKYHGQLRLDDAFLIIAVICLCVATGILYSITYFLYLHSAALLAPEVLVYLLSDFSTLLDKQKRVYPFLALIWTTTFAVKGCFLAFMRPLVWPISRAMNWYYWFMVGFCLISWMFVVADPFIICPYFGVDSIKCFASTVSGTKTLGLTALVTVLDILSDIMILSIPIIVLRNTKTLSRSTKFGLATFLCLSIFMVVCAIARITGFHYKGFEDDTWEFFWQHTEGAVSVMMASITAFRTLFIKTASNLDDDTTSQNSAEPHFRHRVFRRFQALARAQPDEKPKLQDGGRSSSLKLPKIPSPVFTGLRSFIRRNNRTEAATATFVTLDSSAGGSDAEYHAFIGTETRITSGNTPNSPENQLH